MQVDDSAPENMHAFVGDITKLDLPVLNPYLERVQNLYNENMDAYVNAVLRRSFGKSMVSSLTSAYANRLTYFAYDRTFSRAFSDSWRL